MTTTPGHPVVDCARGCGRVEPMVWDFTLRRWQKPDGWLCEDIPGEGELYTCADCGRGEGG